MRILEFTITDQLNNKPVKYLLFNHLKLSDKLVTELKKGEYIKLNGESCTVRKVMKTGDNISITIPETEVSAIIPVKGELDILYEDEDIIAINKPANMPTHPTKYHVDDTLANLVCGYMGNNFIFRAVNRLDKDTTGIVLIAKNRYSAEMLNRQIRNKEIIKEYTAICNGVIKQDGRIEENIKKETARGIKRIISPDGQYSKTNYYPVKSENGCSLIRLNPETGRTHQLRVHMAHIGHPLYGDYLYGKEIPGTRIMLHCSAMYFTHPSTNVKMLVKAPLTDDFFISQDSSL